VVVLMEGAVHRHPQDLDLTTEDRVIWLVDMLKVDMDLQDDEKRSLHDF